MNWWDYLKYALVAGVATTLFDAVIPRPPFKVSAKTQAHTDEVILMRAMETKDRRYCGDIHDTTTRANCEMLYVPNRSAINTWVPPVMPTFAPPAPTRAPNLPVLPYDTNNDAHDINKRDINAH